MTDKTDSKEREVAEQWLRDRYGAYRGHFAWRELEEAFLAGRASLAASAGSEPVAWVDERALSWLANSRSLSATITTKLEKGKSFERPMPLYLHPSPPEGMVGGWRQPLIARALDEWHEDDGPVMWWAWCGRDWAGEPAWCGTPLSSDWPGYHTHWTAHPSMPLPPPPTTSAGSGKGE